MDDRSNRWVTVGNTTFAALAAVRLFIGVAYRPSFFLTLVYDDGAYISRAAMFASGSWATEFTETTFIRGPLYSLYLASVAQSGLPLGVVDALTEILAITWLAFEISKLVSGSSRCQGAVGSALLVVPTAVTATGVHIIRDSLANTLLIAGCAAAIRVVRAEHRLFEPVLVLGSIVGALFITREDAVWCIPPLVALVAFVVVRAARAYRYRDIVVSLVAIVAGVALPSVLVRELNSRSGLDATTLFADSDFSAAHGAIVRYASDGTTRPMALTSSLFDSLVTRSPSFARIAPGMAEWRDATGTIDTDALQFSIARGLSFAGALHDGHQRSSLLHDVAEELAALCQLDQRPDCEGRAGPPPLPVWHLWGLVAAGTRPASGLEELFFVEGPPSGTTGTPGPTVRFLQYTAVTNTTPPPGSYSIDGDEVTFGQRPTTVATGTAAVSLAVGRIIVPLIRIAGMGAIAWLLITRRWRDAFVCLVLLLAAWTRATQVAFAGDIGIGDYDFHYVQLAATLVHVAGVIAIASALGARQSRSRAATPDLRETACDPSSSSRARQVGMLSDE